MAITYNYPPSNAIITGGATEAKQDAEIVILTSIDAGIPASLGQKTMANSMPVAIASDQSAVPVSGPLTDTQLRAVAVPISAASLPLPTGASTEATLSSLNGKVTAVNTGAVVISSSALPTGAATESTLSSLNGKVTAVNTGAVVISSSALPSGASTAAKQPALGTAGTASADVITVQGIASMTALKTDSSATTQPISAASLPLPTGASTETTLSAINTKTPALGQAASAASSPVVIASNQSTLPTNTGVVIATGSAAALNADAIASTDVSAYSLATVQISNTFTGTLTFQGSNDNTNFVSLLTQVITSATATPTSTINTTGIVKVPITFRYLRVRMTAYTSGTADATAIYSSMNAPSMSMQNGNLVTVNGATLLAGNGVTGTGSLRVTLASDTSTNTNPLLVTEQKTSTSTLSNVSSSASNVTVLASNAARKGAMIYNDSTAVLYLKLGTTASTTSFTVALVAGAYYELPATPALYTGIIDGIWAAANGSARVTELS